MNRSVSRYHIGLLSTHPIQYYVPWYRALAEKVDLQVFYCNQQTAEGQAAAGFGVPFDWDVPLLEGYNYEFLANHSRSPNVFTFFGCDTPEINAIIKRRRFDAFILHGWYVKSFWQGALACWRSGTPVLVRGDSQLLTPRTRLKRLAKYSLYRSFIPRFDGYLVVGERARQYYQHYGANLRRMFFVPHAVDNNFFVSRTTALRSEREHLRASFCIPAKAVVYLFAGKLVDKKRPGDFVRAVALASRSREEVHGLIVGDGPHRSKLEEMVRRESLPISFAGFLNQTEMPKAYTASDVLVLPSDGGETWGLVVNEAMASGLPAIVSDQVGCAPDLVRPDKTGAIFQCGNINELALLCKNLARDRCAIEKMGKTASSLIGNYSISKAVNGTIEAVCAVCD